MKTPKRNKGIGYEPNRKLTWPTRVGSSELLSGVELITAERQRQINVEGWTPEHDDAHKKHELLFAALSYVAAVATPDEWNLDQGLPQAPCHDWPWAKKWWKPSDDPIRNLVKAGALIAAEIDRLERRKAKPENAGTEP